MKLKLNNHLFFGLLIFASVVGIIVRLSHINAAVADWHSWRQVDTAAVARNFQKFGFDLLHPRYDDVSNIQSGRDNPNGWRMVEFPLYQGVGYELYKLVPRLSIEEALRLVSVFSVAGSIFLFGLLALEFMGAIPAIIGAFLYAVLPFSIYYGRTILPDPFGTFWALLSLVILSKNSVRKSVLWTLVAGLSAGISLLVRPMEAFVLLPAVYLLLKDFSFKKTTVTVILYSIVAVVPLFFWRKWILQYPEGIAASDWLFNKDGIRFKGAWFYWIFDQRIGDLILGAWGLIPFGLGLIVAGVKKDRIFSYLWLAGALLYVIIFAGGNVQHDYYQALIIPIIIWFTAKGVDILIKSHEGISRIASISLVVISLVFMWIFSWYTMRTYFWINHPEIVEAGIAADKLIPKYAKVIAPYGGDTTFLYQTKRQGWPIGFEIDKKIKMGAQYYVTVNPADPEAVGLARTYSVLVNTKTYEIIDLTRKK